MVDRDMAPFWVEPSYFTKVVGWYVRVSIIKARNFSIAAPPLSTSIKVLQEIYKGIVRRELHCYVYPIE